MDAAAAIASFVVMDLLEAALLAATDAAVALCPAHDAPSGDPAGAR